MRFLVLGGTNFVGRHLVERALAEGHEVVLFNRGRTNPGIFDGAEEVLGDRDGGLDGLKGRTFDRVVDVSGYVPRIVRQSAELLKDATEHYTFVSTVSVYADFTKTYLDEDSPVATMADESVEGITDETYGPLKALCEDVVSSVYDERYAIVRPGIVAGPFDHTDRFTYWCVRASKGGELVAPGDPGRPVQFIDARDLAAFILHLSKESLRGVFNANGPWTEAIDWDGFLETCIAVGRSRAEPVWVPERVLRDAGVQIGQEVPLYAPMDMPGFATVDSERAISAGLRFSALERSVEDTLRWARAERLDLAAGMTPEREAEILETLRRSRI
ncbi:MAG: NAD-dependent epimerase/dehydratase family protein [Actinomycetota bacterium]